MTIREALRGAAGRLELHRVSNAPLTAEVLLAHLLSVSREYLHAHDDRILRDEESDALENAIYERISGAPLQYIVGLQEFYGRYFHVNPSVLIPRPETEHIIEAVLEIAATTGTGGQTPRCRILDVGTGSGCIAVTLALEIPGSDVFAGDISEQALRVARNNASNLKAQVGFVCTDVMDAVNGSFEFIVSNPPYVAPGDLSRLQREVRDHEPHVALFAPGDDGLGIYRKLAQAASECMAPRGHLVMEIGLGMEERVLSLFGPEWEKLPTETDLQGIPRTVIVRRIRTG